MEDQKINLLEPQDLPLTPPPKNKTKRLVFLCIGIAIIGVLLIRNHNIIKGSPSGSDYDPITLQPKKIGFLENVRNFIFKSDNVMIGQQDDRINILLLGIGGPGHEGAYLSDTNMIVSIKPSTKQVAMISVPRDLSVNIPGYGYRKVNNANAFGELKQAGNGGEFARQVFENNFGISIPYYARVDFKAFTEIIDAIGGINIEVERSFVDSAYPGPNYSYQTVIFEAGPQHMNGERALIFSRSRHGNNGEGSDFARAKRQQMVITAFKKKMLSSETFLNPLTLQKIISSLSQHVATNIEFGQMVFLGNLAREINSDEIKTLVLDNSPNGFLRQATGEGGAYLLAPKSGNFNEIEMAINTIFETTTTPTSYLPAEEKKPVTASMTIPTARIDILNGTWRAGLAAQKEQELEQKGFFISAISNSSKRPIAVTTIYIVNKNAPDKLITSLAGTLKAPFTTNLPDWLIATYNTTTTPQPDIVVMLGEDSLN
jgi:LCP family protein required for cell wall assembly